MIRPPPLQLKLDNRYPQPLRTPSQPKSESFVAKLYKASWKNPVIALAGLNGLRYAFSCYNAFGDALIDEEEEAEHLFTVSLALSAIYVITFFIQIYGIIGVSLQRLSLVRVYLYLTFFAMLLVTTAAILRGVTYFTLGGELVLECITLALEGRGWQKSLFRGHPWPSSVVPYPEQLAEKQCISAWKHHSLNHIAAVVLFNIIPAMVYYLVVYTYYKQTINPTHNACLLGGRFTAGTTGRRRAERGGYSRIETRERARDNNRANEASMTTARLEYGPAAGGALTPRQRRAAQQAPYTKRATTTDINTTPGSSSTRHGSGSQTKRSFVSRGINRNHRPPPLISSPSPLGLDSIPGAPSYNRGPSRVYAAFAAPVSSSEYDKFV
jgi:hypothetical protein